MSSESTPHGIVELINARVPAGTTGALLFYDTNGNASSDSTNFYWDDTNNRLGVGISSPTGKLHVNQNSTTGAIPTLHLEQDDISEEVLRVTGSAAAGVLTQTIVASATVSAIATTCFIRVNIQDEGDVVTDGNYYVPVYTIT